MRTTTKDAQGPKINLRRYTKDKHLQVKWRNKKKKNSCNVNVSNVPHGRWINMKNHIIANQGIRAMYRIECSTHRDTVPKQTILQGDKVTVATF